MKVRVVGFKANDYNATYQQATFLFEERIFDDGMRNIKITDINSGHEFWVTVPIKVETPSRKRKRN